jgi:hypothetical protein
LIVTRPAQAFANHHGGNVRNLGQTSEPKPDELPYGKIRNGEMPPMMFQIRLNNGQTISFAYSDVREIRSRDAGHVQLGVFAMSRVMITIEGRNLGELTNLLGLAMIRWIAEADPRAEGRPEASPEIDSISIEPIDAG